MTVFPMFSISVLGINVRLKGDLSSKLMTMMMIMSKLMTMMMMMSKLMMIMMFSISVSRINVQLTGDLSSSATLTFLTGVQLTVFAGLIIVELDIAFLMTIYACESQSVLTESRLLNRELTVFFLSHCCDQMK